MRTPVSYVPPAPTIVPLTPHRYPVWLVSVAGAILLMTLYAAVLVPRYFSAAKLLEGAQAADATHDLPQAVTLLKKAAAKVPDSRKITVQLAYEQFQTGDGAAAVAALYGLPLEGDELTKLLQVMSPKDRETFLKERE